MALQDRTLLKIRQLTRAYLFETDSTGAWTSALVNAHINTGLTDMVQDAGGIEDVWQTTCVVGLRTYQQPPGLIRVKAAFYNGLEITFCRYVDNDFFSSGNSTVDRFALWQNQIILGPRAPANTYVLKLVHFREPQELVNDNDIPEIPNRFRVGPAYYAAAQLLIPDGKLQDAQVMMAQYNRVKDSYRDWVLGKTRTNLRQVRVEVL